ncbi:MAG: lytic murein transglycosylase, partial [Candidatus Saccharimonadales bacterium]
TEAQYQQQVQNKQAVDQKAATIKTRIFNLLGVSKAPDFQEAYTIAKYASGITGVRPALILAILTQESNLGKNVGQCYLQDSDTGTGVKISTGAASPKTMSPRQVPIFMSLTQQLGLDPYHTPVSCVIYYHGAPYGWGGAMGPGQFEPSTWASGYSSRVASITGKTANPWNINDAFLATALLLQDNGAAANEFNAAMKYYCGGGCTSYDRFYGNSVISIANQYEADIQAIGG